MSCTHHYLVETPADMHERRAGDGRSSKKLAGACKLCGKKRKFPGEVQYMDIKKDGIATGAMRSFINPRQDMGHTW